MLRAQLHHDESAGHGASQPWPAYLCVAENRTLCRGYDTWLLEFKTMLSAAGCMMRSHGRTKQRDCQSGGGRWFRGGRRQLEAASVTGNLRVWDKY